MADEDIHICGSCRRDECAKCSTPRCDCVSGEHPNRHATTAASPVPPQVTALIAELDVLAWFATGKKRGKLVPLASFTRDRMAKAFTDAKAALEAAYPATTDEQPYEPGSNREIEAAVDDLMRQEGWNGHHRHTLTRTIVQPFRDRVLAGERANAVPLAGANREAVTKILNEYFLGITASEGHDETPTIEQAVNDLLPVLPSALPTAEQIALRHPDGTYKTNDEIRAEAAALLTTTERKPE